MRGAGAVARLTRDAELGGRSLEHVALLVVRRCPGYGVALHAVRIPAHGALGLVGRIQESVASWHQAGIIDQIHDRQRPQLVRASALDPKSLMMMRAGQELNLDLAERRATKRAFVSLARYAEGDARIRNARPQLVAPNEQLQRAAGGFGAEAP